MRIAINGFGRIGRIFFRQAFGNPLFDIVAINDLGQGDNLAYLLHYDSVYGRYGQSVEWRVENAEGSFFSGDKKIRFFQEREPQKLPWRDLHIDVVVESTGVFTSWEKAKLHLDAGAKHVVLSAPPKDDSIPTSTPNVGAEHLAGSITSNASCTTNASTPVVAILEQDPGIIKAMLSTVHAYTATQALVDGPDAKDFRRGRAGAHNIVPSSTGAAEAVGQVIPSLKGIFDGIAMRVPVISGSIIDLTFVAKRKTSREEINEILRKSAASQAWQGILRVSDEPLVSSDIIGDPHGSIVDSSLTRVIGDDLVKVCSWYDNEWGYCAMLIKHIEVLRPFMEHR